MTLALTEDAANCECRFRKINEAGVIRTMEGAWAVHHSSSDRAGVLFSFVCSRGSSTRRGLEERKRGRLREAHAFAMQACG